MGYLLRSKILRFILLLGIGASIFLYVKQETHLFLPQGETPVSEIDSELSKLLYIINEHKDGDFEVVFDGRHYKAGWGAQFARQYLNRNGSSIEDAETWIKRYCYRSPREGEVILFAYSDGKQVPMRDVFLDSLAQLNGKISQTAH